MPAAALLDAANHNIPPQTREVAAVDGGQGVAPTLFRVFPARGSRFISVVMMLHSGLPCLTFYRIREHVASERLTGGL